MEILNNFEFIKDNLINIDQDVLIYQKENDELNNNTINVNNQSHLKIVLFNTKGLLNLKIHDKSIVEIYNVNFITVHPLVSLSLDIVQIILLTSVYLGNKWIILVHSFVLCSASKCIFL